MATTEFNLFRIKFIRPSQTDFLHETEKTPGDFFIAAMRDKPSFEHRKRYIWHIGNLVFFTQTTGSFAVGRTSKSTVELYDEESKNFIEADHKESPFTQCLFDSELGIVVIAKKSALNQDTTKIAEKIEALLSQNDDIFSNDIRVEVSPIPDPIGFIKQLSTASLIRRFTAHFAGPNPFDADEYFQHPMSVYLSHANGEEGVTTISGENLDNNTVTEVAKSTAATGNKASARIKRFKSSKPETIHLKGNPVKRRIDEGKFGPEAILKKFQKIYHDIRH